MSPLTFAPQLAVFTHNVSLTGVRPSKTDIQPKVQSALGELRPRQTALSAASTFAGVNGTERSRAPVASNTAPAIAAGTSAQVGSPAPHGTSSGRSMRSIATSGISGNVRIG